MVCMHGEKPIFIACVCFLTLGVFVLGTVSCRLSESPNKPDHGDEDVLGTGWKNPQKSWRQTSVIRAGWEDGKLLWRPASFSAMSVPQPEIEDAQSYKIDKLCSTCHEGFFDAFANNVHREQGCEACHGAGSRHMKSRGQEPSSIISLKRLDDASEAGRPTTPAERNEVCLRCHENEPHAPGTTWRTSVHAHNEVACTDCHTVHYNVPPGTPSTVLGRYDHTNEETAALLASYSAEPDIQSLLGKSNHLAAKPPDVCYRCHADMKRLERVVHPHQIGGVNNFNCNTCHDAHGNISPETRESLCLKCHSGAHTNEWQGSPHDVAGIGCTDCHNPHPKSGLPMSVDQPNVCYRCHSEKRELEEIAHAHQVLGPNGFNCDTCHRPHGKVTSATRSDVCLQCHKGAPTMAWHSSIHFREGVACADCHNAHPHTGPPRVVTVSHSSVRRPKRMPMSVDEPGACFKCHPKIFAMTSMPSHHPIREGKMVCSNCHDGHGQAKGNLKTETVNDLCYECHAEKQGPFVWEHAPVTEDCGNCHNPHGTVANNLLHQPTTFLCLRCHTGHSTHAASPQCVRCHFVNGNTFDIGSGPRDPTIPTTPDARRALFTDCTQCHQQIHGSDLPSGFECGHGMRR